MAKDTPTNGIKVKRHMYFFSMQEETGNPQVECH